MMHRPDFKSFAPLATQHALVPVYRRLVCDNLTPVSAFHRIDTGRCACLFESVIGGEKVGRYSFLAAEPFLEVTARGTQVTQVSDQGTETFFAENPLDILRQHLLAYDAVHLPELPPFAGGAIGYAGYDVVRYCEHLPNAPLDDRELPDLSFAFYDQMVVFDHVNKTMVVIAMARIDQIPDVQAAYDDACRRVDALVELLSRNDQPLAITDIGSGEIDEYSLAIASNFDESSFCDAVRQCVDYIEAGDIFQVVISQRMALPIACHPFEIYRTLRAINPSPFMFYVRSPEVTLVGSSPEIMVRVVDGQVTVRPLAGTRPRGKSEEEDEQFAAELLADPKERAEHVMLVDLGRNDVGRVAAYNTVSLDDVMTIERYSHVMHITSNVTGILAEPYDAFDALQACLPAGTVSGAPKVRAMEIIDQLEPHRRGPYAGAVGYLDFTGNMDTCIALRTIVIQGTTAYVQAGAGIVADSVPANEYQETLNKARGLVKAIAETEQRMAGGEE